VVDGLLRVAGSANARTLTCDLTAGGDIGVAGDLTAIAGSVMARGRTTLAAGVSFLDGLAGSFVEFFAPLTLPSLPSVSGGDGARHGSGGSHQSAGPRPATET